MNSQKTVVNFLKVELVCFRHFIKLKFRSRSLVDAIEKLKSFKLGNYHLLVVFFFPDINII